jgi:hypothetical protein
VDDWDVVSLFTSLFTNITLIISTKGSKGRNHPFEDQKVEIIHFPVFSFIMNFVRLSERDEVYQGKEFTRDDHQHKSNSTCRLKQNIS